MSSQRPSFAKRDREMKLKDKAKQKAERRAARKAEPRTGHGPPIATENPAMMPQADDPVPAVTPGPTGNPSDPTRPR